MSSTTIVARRVLNAVGDEDLSTQREALLEALRHLDQLKTLVPCEDKACPEFEHPEDLHYHPTPVKDLGRSIEDIRKAYHDPVFGHRLYIDQFAVLLEWANNDYDMSTERIIANIRKTLAGEEI